MSITDSVIKLHRGQREVFTDHRRFKVVVAGRRWGKCIAMGTRITMADGSVIPVELVRQGDWVLTVNEDTYALEPRMVQHLHDNGVKETVTVKTSSRSLRCTPNHPLLVNNRWVEAKDIRIGDLVAVSKRTAFGANELPDHVVDYLAIWLAEGAGHIVSNETPEIVDILRKAVESFPRTRLTKRIGENVDWFTTAGRGSGRWNDEAPITTLLKSYGLWKRNSKTKFIPDAIYRLPERQLARFLNLFFACDGSINRKSKNTWAVEIGLANEKMIRQLAELLLKFGIRGQITHKIHKAVGKNGDSFESWRFTTSDPTCIKLFADRIGAVSKETQLAAARESACLSAGNSNSYLPISHDNFAAHLKYESVEKGKHGGHNAAIARDLPDELRLGLNSWRKQNPDRCTVTRYARLRDFSDKFFDPIVDGDLAWEEITAVEAAETVQTYDLTIEGNHNFFAEGISTHNTQLSKQAICRRACIPKQLIWYVAPTYQMARGILWDELKDALPRSWVKSYNETRMTIRLHNGTVIALKGADKPDTLRGVGLHLLIIDEAQDIKSDTWIRVLRPTLATTIGEALIIGTPKSFNWLHDLYQLGQRGVTYLTKKGKKRVNHWKSWTFPTITSPFIPKEEIEQARADMDEKSFRQEFEASFETMSGRVYYAFNRKIHVGSHPFNPKLPIWIGQDFNIDPMSSVIMQPQPNGEIWIVDECILHGSNTQETADELARRYFRHMKQIIFYPDPAGAQRSTKGRGESDLDILRDAGFTKLKYRRKHPKIADRVNAVNRMFKSAEGKIKMRVNDTCKNTIKSLEQTIYKENSREVDKSEGNEHAADALGYCIDLEFPMRAVKILGVSL